MAQETEDFESLARAEHGAWPLNRSRTQKNVAPIKNLQGRILTYT